MVVGPSDQPSPTRPPTLPRHDTRTLETGIFAMNHSRSFLSMALLLPAIIDLPGESVPPKLGPAAMDSYQQTVWVTFRSEAAARRAQVHIAPLYHDLQVAFATRMDDSNLNDVRIAEVMARFGQKGTFFLCDPGSWWQDSTATGVKVTGDPGVEVPRILLAGGNSIGGHTLNHEMLPALSRNSAFGEILGGRVALEVRAAAPNIAFTYPYVVFKSELRDGVDRADLEEMLRRSGYYQLAEHRYNEDWDSGLQDSVFIVCDGSTAGGSYDESGLTQGRSPKDRPLFLVTMHAWVKEWGGADYPRLAEIYRRWSGRKDWWYCNLNEYGSYRYQAAHSRLATFARGNVVKVVLQRPDPLDLGDQTPLTFRIDGTSREDIVSVACAEAETKPVPLEAGYAFDLFHDRGRGAIEAYAATDNPENSDRLEEAKGGMEGLRARLYRRDQVLTLALRNQGTLPLRDLRVIFRLPLRWQEGVVRKQLSLDAGASANLQVSLTERPEAESYRDGPEYDVAQIDLVGRRRARLYAVCRIRDGEPAAFFARNGFRVLGPLAGDLANFDPQVFAKPWLEGAAAAASYPVPWGGNVAWHTLPESRTALLDPDIIPTGGRSGTPETYTWDPALYFPHARAHYLLHGWIVSPDDRTVRAVFRREYVKGLSLNGRLIGGDELKLQQGSNDVRILYVAAPAGGGSYDEGNYGCYFRLVDAAGRRVEDVRFDRGPTP